MRRPDHAARRKSALEGAREHADALLVTTLPNVRYLTGFTGSNGQLLLADEPVFLTDGRYTEQSAQQVPDVDRHVYGGEGLAKAVRGLLAERGVGRLAVEATNVTLDAHAKLTGELDGVELVATADVVERCRMRKDHDEIQAIREAQRIAERALVEVLESWDGSTEVDLAMALEWAVRTGGGEAVSFDVIVASGAHAALPHAEPRPVAVDPEVLLIDMGAVADGYCSDMTRTYLGDAPDPLPRAHAAVVDAVRAATEAIRPGVTGKEVDAAARTVLDAAGFGEHFVHSTGHGVGLEIHEGPRLSTASDARLEEGMVITVEPGVYLPGVGGIRVEDLVVVTADGADVLTSLPHGPQRPGRRA